MRYDEAVKLVYLKEEWYNSFSLEEFEYLSKTNKEVQTHVVDEWVKHDPVSEATYE